MDEHEPVDADADAAPAPAEERPRPPSRVVREVVETLLTALAIYVGVQLLTPPYQVEGASMDPSLQNGERLLLNRPVYLHFDLNEWLNLLPGQDRKGEWIVYPFHAPERGDIIVFHPPGPNDGKPYIKRVIGLPGDEVAFDDGHVTINGQHLDEPYLTGPITDCDRGPHCRTTVPEGTVYVLGDNRDNSADSRVFGPVDIDRIIGKAWFANWPLDAFGLIPGAEYPNE